MLNQARVEGIVSSLEIHDDKTTGIIHVRRNSGVMDNIPFITYDKDIKNGWGAFTGILGTQNVQDDQGFFHKRMMLILSKAEAQGQYLNEIEFEGFLVKKDVLRQTPKGRVVLDAVFAINMGTVSYYPSAITWFKEAEELNNLPVGSKVVLSGRFQSRDYVKRIDNVSETRTAYEISVKSLEVVYEQRKSERD